MVEGWMTLAGTRHLATIVCTESGGARHRERRGQRHGCVRSYQPTISSLLFIRCGGGGPQQQHLVAEYYISDIKCETCRT